MKLTFISDTHTRHAGLLYESGDILIHCGDFTNKGSLEDTWLFAQFMATLDYSHKIVIAGNHDFCFENEDKEEAEKLLSERGIIYLNDSGIEIEGVKIWGSPIQPTFFDWVFNRERGADIRKHWALIPDDIDVLITHGPPWGILDVVMDGRNVGCEDLLESVLKIKPKIHAFGHIHEDYGVVKKGGTTFVNACSVDEHYRIKNNPIILDVL